VTIRQVVGDYSDTSSKSFGPGATFEVSAAVGDEEIKVVLTCLGCSVQVLDD
jgi:hypothetical protein